MASKTIGVGVAIGIGIEGRPAFLRVLRGNFFPAGAFQRTALSHCDNASKAGIQEVGAQTIIGHWSSVIGNGQTKTACVMPAKAGIQDVGVRQWQGDAGFPGQARE